MVTVRVPKRESAPEFEVESGESIVVEFVAGMEDFDRQDVWMFRGGPIEVRRGWRGNPKALLEGDFILDSIFDKPENRRKLRRRRDVCEEFSDDNFFYVRTQKWCDREIGHQSWTFPIQEDPPDTKVLTFELTAPREPGRHRFSFFDMQKDRFGNRWTVNDTTRASPVTNLMLTVSEPPAPEFAVRSVDAPSQVDLGNSATVTVSVGNTGDGSGTATVQVSANGSLVGGRSVSLDPGDVVPVEFTWTPGATGTFTLTGRANGSTGTATVEVQEAPPPPPPPEEECTVPIPVLGDVNCVVAAAGVGGLGLLGLVAGMEG